MIRRLVNFAAVVFLLACATAAAGVGARSFYRKDKLEYVSEGGRLVMLISTRGRLDLLHKEQWAGEPGLLHIRGLPSTTGLTDSSRRLLGFGGGGRADGTRFVNIPYWFLGLAFAIPAALLVRRDRRLRKPRPGRCASCGYDLRATPDRCPECGTARAV